MKNIFYILIAAFSLILHAKCVGQNNIVYGAGISYTNGVPTFVPPSKSARVAIDTSTSKWYEYATPGGWRWSGDRVTDISGCAAPAYTPGKAQSRLVLNSCTEAQNGHGPELYKYTGSAWLCLNCGGNYTAGDGIDIIGTEITNTAPDQVVSITGAGINAVTGTYPNFTVTGTEVDGSATNELQTLSVVGNDLTISDGNTVTLPTPSSTLDGLTDVTITSPANNQILQYSSAGSQWVNATLSVITGTGMAGQAAFFSSSTEISSVSNFAWDNALKRLTITGLGVQGSGNTVGSFRVLNSTGEQVFFSRDNFGFEAGRSLLYSETGNSAGQGSSTLNSVKQVYTVGCGSTNISMSSGSISNMICASNTVLRGYPSTSNCVTIGEAANPAYTLDIRGVSGMLGVRGRAFIGADGTAIPTNAAMLVKSTTGVLVPPNMTSTQRDAIATPPNGIIYNTTTGKFQGYAAGTWVDLH